MSDLHRHLKALRKGAHLTQTDLAQRLGVTPGHISKVEAGHTAPSPDLAQRWAQVCGGSLEVVGPAQELLLSRFEALSDGQQEAIQVLALLLPSLPDGLQADLLERVQAWRRRYGE